VEDKVKEAQVGEEDLAGLIVMVNDGGPQAKMAEEMVARYLGKHCSSTRQLAAFMSKEMLPAVVLARILDCINKHYGESDGEVVDVTKAEDIQKEVLKDREEGSICWALYKEEMIWCRAILMEKTQNGWEVEFTDYGGERAVVGEEHLVDSLEHVSLGATIDSNGDGHGGEEEVVVDFQKEEKEANKGKGMTKIYNAGAVDGEGIEQEKGNQDEKDIIERFFEFTNFPQELRAKMAEAFFEQKAI